MHGIYIHITHTGVRNESLLLHDIRPTTDGPTAYRRAGPVYVRVNSSVDLAYTSDVAASFEAGTLRGFMNLGYLEAEVRFGDQVEGVKKWSGLVSNSGDPVELFLDGVADKQLLLEDNTAVQYDVKIIAQDTGAPTETAWWHIVGGAVRGEGAGTIALIGANIGFTQNAGGDSSGWSLDLDVDTDTGAVTIKGTVPASEGDVSFVASGQITLVTQ